MNKFYSSLVINHRIFPDIHQVFKPRYNKEFFKRLTANLDQLNYLVEKRCRTTDECLSSESLQRLKHGSKKLLQLKGLLEKSALDDPKYKQTLEQSIAIEDKLMPTVVAIPNRLSKQVPENETVIDEVKSNFLAEQGLSKVLSHRKLSYINNSYSKSIVGPNSHYYFGIGAKLQQSLSEYFITELEKENFVPVSGLCLAKSAVIEAANSRESKNYTTDPCRILNESPKPTATHLVEASRECLASFLTTIGTISSNDPLKLVTSGAGYRAGSDWFDGDDKRITQFETAHAIILNSSIEQYSLKEYHEFRDLLWNCYKGLETPCRLVHCSSSTMLANEYDAHRIEIWLPSEEEWIQVGRISHYLDYITNRVGMKRGHLIDSMLFDGQVLAAALIENRQTSRGRFIIPHTLKEHMVCLSETERKEYFNREPDFGAQQITGVMLNHEQRRYLVKKSYRLGHSKEASKSYERRTMYRSYRMAFAVSVMFAALIDWSEVRYRYVPDIVSATWYDYVYRPARRLFRSITAPENRSGEQLPDLAWIELDKTQDQKTMSQRRKEKVLQQRDTERWPIQPN